jgi:hypothetical protein
VVEAAMAIQNSRTSGFFFSRPVDPPGAGLVVHAQDHRARYHVGGADLREALCSKGFKLAGCYHQGSQQLNNSLRSKCSSHKFKGNDPAATMTTHRQLKCFWSGLRCSESEGLCSAVGSRHSSAYCAL